MHQTRTTLPSRDRNDWQTVRKLLPFLWRFRWRVGLALASLLAAKGANVGVPLALKEIVDALDPSLSPVTVLPLTLLVAYGLLRMASSLFNELRDSIFARVRHGVTREISTRALGHLHTLSLRFHLDRRTGGVARDIERGSRSAASLLNYLVFSILPTFVEVGLITAILLANYDVRFTLITLGTVGLYVAFTFFVTEWRMKYRVTMNAEDSKASGHAVDGLLNYETVKYFNNEGLELERYGRSMRAWEEAAVKSQTSMSALNFGQGAIIAAGLTLVMLLAGREVVAGTMSLGDLVLVNTFLLQLFIPLGFLGVVYSQVKHALSDMEQLFKLLEREPEIRDREGAPVLAVGGGEVRFENVSFAYEPDRPILHDLSFTIAPGQKVAVVGASGAGKSTLSRLLFRFYEVNGGRITVNGRDLREVTQASLRAAIGIVPQDTVLFNDTLYYNIAYARPGASREEVERAARMAHLDRFIATLPAGYETVVGERGLKLSGGEKQRVAIARVILKAPKILVFDEATSSLDSRSEQAILDALREVAADHTTLVIAHRLSTIVDADQILVLEGGRIVERGSHDGLLERGGAYAHLWTLQQRERERPADAA
ncbi:ABCB family ABC transporter ATP-binding protein/permease [Endothiovibrio diazotrophicus]